MHSLKAHAILFYHASLAHQTSFISTFYWGNLKLLLLGIMSPHPPTVRLLRSLADQLLHPGNRILDLQRSLLEPVGARAEVAHIGLNPAR